MKYTYDFNSDCAYISINELPHSYSKEIDESRFVDYATDGTVTGIELLYVSGGVDTTGLPYEAEINKLLDENGNKVFA